MKKNHDCMDPEKNDFFYSSMLDFNSKGSYQIASMFDM